MLQQRLHVGSDLHSFFGPQPLILVQNAGMRQWLKLRLTQSQGAFARIELPFPGSALFALQQQILGIDSLPYAKQWPMVERIAVLLDQLKHDPLMHPATEQWLDPTDPAQCERKRWKLAQLVADTFQEYELYRWNMIETWRQEPT
ncbi:exodeoxyribonuclease V subunit gamma, partial [Arthrospira platensis SPKY1]|nr:exodeoxyribonuclease V subunit gamma [Arthrospira platensis SPKY1]